MTRAFPPRWIPLLLLLGGCSAAPVTRAAGCWDLLWFRDGAPQIGPLLPDHVHLTDHVEEDAGAAPGPGEWFQVEKAPGVVDTSTSPFAAAVSWPETFLERGWRSLSRDSALLVLVIPESVRMEIRFGFEGPDRMLGTSAYQGGDGSASVVEVRAARRACEASPA